MPLTIQLLGRPGITRDAGEVYAFRSRKSWAVLAYLILGERPPSRSQLARLLFAEANDPVRALRRARVDHLLIRTDQPFTARLRYFFRSRHLLGRGAR